MRVVFSTKYKKTALGIIRVLNSMQLARIHSFHISGSFSYESYLVIFELLNAHV